MQTIPLTPELFMNTLLTAAVLGMSVYLFALNKKALIRNQKGWRLILTGAGLITFATAIGVVEASHNLVTIYIFDDFALHTFAKEIIGYLGGFLFLFIGFLSWLPLVEQLEESHANVKLQERENILNSALNASPSLIAISSVIEGRHREVNDHWLQTLGYTRGEVIGKTVEDLNIWPTPEHRQEVVQILAEEGRVQNYETQLRKRSGEFIDIMISASKIVMDGEDCILFIAQDITRRRRMEAALIDSEAELRGILSNMEELYYRADENGVITFAAGPVKEITGWEIDEVINMNATDFYASDDGRDRFFELLEKGNGKVRNFESLMNYKDGKRAWVSTNAQYMLDYAGEVVGVEGTVRDVTHMVENREALEHMALHDPLTGLNNRRSYEHHLNEALARARRSKVMGAVVFIDLDGFKEINDTLGHNFGDEVLKLTSKRLRVITRETDFIARLGGDEFCVIIEQTQNKQAARIYAKKMIEAVSPDITIEGKQARVYASAGVVMFDGFEPGDTVRQIIAEADKAMYAAKRSGGDTFCFSDEIKSTRA